MKDVLFSRLRQRARDRRATFRALHLSDAVLRDIGLSRTDMEAAMLFGAGPRPRARRTD